MGQLYTPWCVIRTSVLVTSESKQKPFFLWHHRRRAQYVSVIFQNISLLTKISRRGKLHLPNVTCRFPISKEIIAEYESFTSLCLWPGLHPIFTCSQFTLWWWWRWSPGRTDQAVNTAFGGPNITDPSVFVHFALKVWVWLPLIFHFLLLCSSTHSLIFWSCTWTQHSLWFSFCTDVVEHFLCNLTRWKWTKLDT